jgi:hypothetical protein
MRFSIYSALVLFLLGTLPLTLLADRDHHHKEKYDRSDKDCKVKASSWYSRLFFWSKDSEKKFNRKCDRRHRFAYHNIKKYMGCSVSDSDYQGMLDGIAAVNLAAAEAEALAVAEEAALAAAAVEPPAPEPVSGISSRRRSADPVPVEPTPAVVVEPVVIGPVVVAPPQPSKWAGGKIFYLIDQDISPRRVARIKNAMLELSAETSLLFVEKSSADINYVKIVSKTEGCFSKVGQVGGEQELNLGEGCFKSHLILHQLLHVAGFWHEQARCDRDQFVKINFDKIQSDKVANFNRRCAEESQCAGDARCIVEEGLGSLLPYDRRSIMHYGKHYYANHPGQKSIVSTSKKRRERKVGPKIFSELI